MSYYDSQIISQSPLELDTLLKVIRNQAVSIPVQFQKLNHASFTLNRIINSCLQAFTLEGILEKIPSDAFRLSALLNG